MAIGIEAKPKKLSEYHWESLLTAIYQKQCIPIIGQSAIEFLNQGDDPTVITLKELSKEWAQKYEYPFQDSDHLPKVAQFLAIREGNDRFPKEIISNKFRKMKHIDFSSVNSKIHPI